VFSDGTLKYRVNGVTYTNTTKKPVTVHIEASLGTTSSMIILTVNGEALRWPNVGAASPATSSIETEIQAGETYILTASTGTITVVVWKEKR
jgi:hypothetical protein